MLNDTELEKILSSKFPNWNWSMKKSGIATWIYLTDGNICFNIQVTPSDGVGVSIIDKSHTLNLSGHDEVFDDIAQAVNYLEGVIK